MVARTPKPKRSNSKIWRYRLNPRYQDYGGNQYFYRRAANQRNLEYKARTGTLGRPLPSGFYKDQTWGGLLKAWVAYIISDIHDDHDRKKYYSAVINKLQGELNLQKYPFAEMRHAVAEYLSDNYKDNPELNDMSVEEIEELMKKSDDEFWGRVNS